MTDRNDVDFVSALSNKYLRKVDKASVIKYTVNRIDVTNKKDNGEIEKTIMLQSPNMGVYTIFELCGFCGMPLKHCIGHGGYIELNTMIFNTHHKSLILNILNLSSIGTDIIYKSYDTLDASNSGNRGNRTIGFIIVDKNSKKYLTNGEVYNILKMINPKIFDAVVSASIRTVATAKFNNMVHNLHPDRFNTIEPITGSKDRVLDIFTNVMYCLPNQYRSASILDSDGTPLYSNNDFKIYYDNVIKNSNIDIPTDELAIYQRYILQVLDIKVLPTESQKKIKTTYFKPPNSTMEMDVNKIIAGKMGVYRGSTVSKRINNGIRTVIGPSTIANLKKHAYYKGSKLIDSPLNGGRSLEFGTIGVPSKMFQIIHKKTIITAYNIKSIQNYLLGKQNYKFSIISNNLLNRRYGVYSEAYFNENSRLTIGDSIFIHNPTLGILNRQPTHTRYSLSCNKIIPSNNNTIKVTSQITDSLGADYDGDESNVIIATDDVQEIECGELMHVRKNLKYCLDASVVYGMYYNALIGISTLCAHCDSIMLVHIEHILNNFVSTSVTPEDRLLRLHDFNYRFTKVYGCMITNGHYVISMILPKGLNYHYKKFHVVDGIVLPGSTIEKSHIKSGYNTIFNAVLSQFGNEVTSDILTMMQWIGDNFVSFIKTLTLSVDDIRPVSNIYMNFSRTYLQVSGYRYSLQKHDIVKNYINNINDPNAENERANLIKMIMSDFYGRDEIKAFLSFIELIVKNNIEIDEYMSTPLLQAFKLKLYSTKFDNFTKFLNTTNSIIRGIGDIYDNNFKCDNSMDIVTKSGTTKSTKNSVLELSYLIGNTLSEGDMVPKSIGVNHKYPNGSKMTIYNNIPELSYGVQDDGMILDSFISGMSPMAFSLQISLGLVNIIDKQEETKNPGVITRFYRTCFGDCIVDNDGYISDLATDRKICKLTHLTDSNKLENNGNTKIQGNSLSFFNTEFLQSEFI